MSFVPYAQGQASGFGSGLPRAIHAQHVAEQARAAALSAFAAGLAQAPQPPPLTAHAPGHTTRPNIVRHVTGGLQALYSNIANAAIEHAENEQRRQQQLHQQRSQPSSRAAGRSSHSPRQSYGNDVARAGVEAADIAAAAAGGAAGAVPPPAQEWTRSDGFLRISSTLPLLNQSVHRRPRALSSSACSSSTQRALAPICPH